MQYSAASCKVVECSLEVQSSKAHNNSVLRVTKHNCFAHYKTVHLCALTNSALLYYLTVKFCVVENSAVYAVQNRAEFYNRKKKNRKILFSKNKYIWFGIIQNNAHLFSTNQCSFSQFKTVQCRSVQTSAVLFFFITKQCI